MYCVELEGWWFFPTDKPTLICLLVTVDAPTRIGPFDIDIKKRFIVTCTGCSDKFVFSL